MDFISTTLSQYAENHTSPEPELLRQISRETYSKVMMPRMLSGHLQGRYLSMISKIVRPKQILEIGTYTGYSAICLAEGLQPGGQLITIDNNEELEDIARQNIAQSGYRESIQLIIGNGLEVIPSLAGGFDLVFIDADKENYLNYFNLVIDRIAIGGVILADNVLWSGKVLESETDKDTVAIKQFNDQVQNDPRVENVLLPIRDGIMMMRRVSL